MLPQLFTYNLPNIIWELPVQKDYVCLFTLVSHTGCPMWQGWPLTICGVETLQGEDVSVSCSGHIGSPSLIHLEVRHLLCHVSMAVLQVTLNHLQAPTHLFQLEAQMTQLSAINLKLLCTAFIMAKWGGLKTTILFEIRFVSGEATCANVPVVYTRHSLTNLLHSSDGV